MHATCTGIQAALATSNGEGEDRPVLTQEVTGEPEPLAVGSGGVQLL